MPKALSTASTISRKRIAAKLDPVIKPSDRSWMKATGILKGPLSDQKGRYELAVRIEGYKNPLIA